VRAHDTVSKFSRWPGYEFEYTPDGLAVKYKF